MSASVFLCCEKTKGVKLDYHITDYKPAHLVKLDILLNGDSVDALSALIHVDNAYPFGRRICEKLKELIPRQQFDIAIQAAIGFLCCEKTKGVKQKSPPRRTCLKFPRPWVLDKY